MKSNLLVSVALALVAALVVLVAGRGQVDIAPPSEFPSKYLQVGTNLRVLFSGRKSRESRLKTHGSLLEDP